MCTSSAEQFWAVLVLYFGSKGKKYICATCTYVIHQNWPTCCVHYRRLKTIKLLSNSLLFSANQSVHIRAFFHWLSVKWIVFGFAFPKLCNWFKTNQSTNIKFVLTNQNQSLLRLHLFSHTWQQWPVFALHSDWFILFFFRCACEHYGFGFYDSHWKTVQLVTAKQGN